MMADRTSVDEAVVEASHSAKHLLTVGVQLFQLVLDQRCVQWSALLDQVLPENNQGVDLVGVQGDFLFETLQKIHEGRKGPAKTKIHF